MPKVPMKKPEEKKEVVQPVETKAPVYRLFECVVYLEIALAELKKVGIYPGEKAEQLKVKVSGVTVLVEELKNEYLTLWGAMSK